MFSKLNAFTSWHDVWYAFIGFLAGLLNIPEHGWIVSFCISLIYTAYQSLDEEGRQKSIEDLVKFVVGFVLSIPIVLFAKTLI